VDSNKYEIESEAWYRAVAEGRLRPATDRRYGAPQQGVVTPSVVLAPVFDDIRLVRE